MKALLLLCFFLTGYFSNATDTTHNKKYSAQLIRDDLSFMLKAMEEVHPDIFHTITREELQRKLDSVQATITEGMTAAEAWPKFAILIGAINEGHTSLSWPQDYSSPQRKLFPVYLKDFDGSSFIVRLDASDENALLPGDRITAINGETAESIVKRYLPYQGGLPSWKNLMVAFQLRFYLALTGFTDPFTIRYVRSGSEKTTVVKSQTNEKLNAKMAEYRRTNSSALDAYNFSVLPDRVGFMNFRSMDNPTRFAAFADSVFREIDEQDLKGLIIDLRQNGGGNSVLGDQLLAFITSKKYRMAAGMKWKISQPYKDYYNQLPDKKKFLNGNSMEKQYLGGRNGDFLTVYSNRVKPKKQKRGFRGPVCFLIGSNTFSSANMLANAVKDYQLATLIGEPTGECPNDFGELITLKTPNLGVEFSTSTKQYIRANGDANDKDPILPDHYVKDDPGTSKDETLEFAKNWILQQRKR